MTTPRYILSLDADGDLDALFQYLAIQSGVDRAIAIFDRIEEVLQLLARSPKLGRRRRELDGAPRTFVVLRWVIFYEPMESGEGIYVWRIVDGSRDLRQLIAPPKQPKSST